MTRARTRTYGVVTPSLIQLSLEALLCVFVSLVQGARSTLQMIIAYVRRDWHTTDANEALPRETTGNHATTPILRDDRRSAPIRQDEAGGRGNKGNHHPKHNSLQALIPRGFAMVRKADELVQWTNSNEEARSREAIVSKDGGVLTRLSNGSVEHARSLLSFRAKALCAEDPDPGATRTVSTPTPGFRLMRFARVRNDNAGVFTRALKISLN